MLQHLIVKLVLPGRLALNFIIPYITLIIRGFVGDNTNKGGELNAPGTSRLRIYYLFFIGIHELLTSVPTPGKGRKGSTQGTIQGD